MKRIACAAAFVAAAAILPAAANETHSAAGAAPPSEAALAAAPLLEAENGAWVERPNVREFMLVFPRRALETGESGDVSLECLVGEDHRLSCVVRAESPPNRGFADAALSLSPKLRIAPTLANGQETRGGRLFWDVRFATTGRAALTGEIPLGASEIYPLLD
jgi:outer membrane biosynthesis protein TonB